MGLSEKNATSEPDTNPESMRSINNTNPFTIKNSGVVLCNTMERNMEPGSGSSMFISNFYELKFT